MDNLLTPEQLAEFLQVSTATVYRWTHEGYVPYFKMNPARAGNIRFDKHKILKWLSMREKKGRTSRKIKI